MALLRPLAIALCLLAIAPGGAHAASTLFVQEASGGVLRKQAGKDRYVLTIAPRGDITAFTDRPARRAWRLGTRTFPGRWSLYGFATVPPNAALVIDGGDTLAVTLLSARGTRGGRVTFTVAPLQGDAGALAGYARRADDPREGRFGPASLFIDDAGVRQRSIGKL